jgi:hypothetical protein
LPIDTNHSITPNSASTAASAALARRMVKVSFPVSVMCRLSTRQSAVTRMPASGRTTRVGSPGPDLTCRHLPAYSPLKGGACRPSRGTCNGGYRTQGRHQGPRKPGVPGLATPEGVAAWWAEDTHGDREAGGTVKVRFTNNGQEIGAMEMKLEQLIPGELVLWRFLAGPAEWIGTHARSR